MSTSRRRPRDAQPKKAASDDFSTWLGETHGAEGDFTALVVLVSIDAPRVTPLASTFLTFVGDEVDWSHVAHLFSGSGKAWDGASFFPVLDGNGPLENGEARARLRLLEARITQDRLVLNEGAFFDQWGRRLKVEEMPSYQ